MSAESGSFMVTIPPPVEMPGDPSTPPGEEEDDEIEDKSQGYFVRARYKVVDELDTVKNLLLRFSTNEQDPWDTESPYLELNVLGDSGDQAAWKDSDVGDWVPLEEMAGGTYTSVPDLGWSTITVSPANPGTNTILVDVRGNEATIELNEIVIGFIPHPNWLAFRSVYALPRGDGSVHSTDYGHIQQPGKELNTLKAQRHIPGWVWGLFGTAAGVFVVSSIAKAFV